LHFVSDYFGHSYLLAGCWSAVVNKRDLFVISKAMQENSDRAYRWGMALLNKQLQQEPNAGKLRRVIEFKTQWRKLYESVKK